MERRDKILGQTPEAAALWVTGRIKPVKLRRRLTEQVETSDFRCATVLCRRALGAGRGLPASWNVGTDGPDEEQRYWLRQLLQLVDALRIEQRHRPNS